MAHSDDNVSQGGLLLEERPAGRKGPERRAPHTDRWWLVEAPPRTEWSRSGRGPAHHSSRTQTHSDGLPLGHLFEPVTPAGGLHWPDRALTSGDLSTDQLSADLAALAEGRSPERTRTAKPGRADRSGSSSSGRRRQARAVPQQTAHSTPPGGLPIPAAGAVSAGTAGHAVSIGHTGGFPTIQYGHTGRAPLPRRRDVRAGRVAPPPVVSGAAPTRGLALGLPQAHAPATVAPLALGPTPATAPTAPTALTGAARPDGATAPLPRRRDLRAAEQAQSRRALREARKSELSDASRSHGTATTVARGAVLTGLVAVGVVTITGQHLDLGTATPSDASAELSLPSAAPAVEPAPAFEVYPGGDRTEWQVGSDARAQIVAGLAEVKAKQAAARRAAAKRAAEKAAAEARVAAKAQALRNAQRNPRAIGRIMAAERGWTGSQWTCLDLLWKRESMWRYNADNPSSSAYGIPQALPGSRMASAGSDWRTNPVTQIKWGLDYIETRYGSPCNAWAHSERTGWY